MALLTINSKNLELTLKVGILEEYKPTPEIINLHGMVKELDHKTNIKIKEIVGELKDQQKAVDILAKDENKRDQWKNFLVSEYNVDLAMIIDKIRDINKSLCPDYEKFIKKN